eukprot:TRINITY_DN24220_c0_g1_i1.p2 TRINITY_DN24220_c0_g1~~TRINITY_DN24220_c0_g1_i1.p2  ORF type:complete len:287 (+),score=96.88 TRINITY_DN24220_c0_g1_i1:56-916(+)
MSTVRGLVGNTVGLGLLGALGHGLDLKVYCALAAGIQYAVYLVHGLPNRSEKFYDLSGSATHLALVFTSLIRTTRPRSVRQIFVALAATLWMTRLGSFLFLRISRDGRDDRFDKIKTNALNFLSAWTIQALWVALTEAPVLLINETDDTAPLTAVDAVAFTGWSAGFLLEALADVQKFVFRCNPENKGKFITEGVWKYCRHPNYFGEIMMWASLALSVSSSSSEMRMKGAWVSPAFTAALLLGLSGVPMVEKAGMKKWGTDPAYLHYIKNTSCIIPWFAAPAFKGN